MTWFLGADRFPLEHVEDRRAFVDTLEEEDLNVKKNMCVVAGLLCALSISADQDVTVQARTPIELTLLHHVHSGFSRAGAPVWLRVAEDVMVDDRVVVRAGTIAECRLAASRGAQSLGHGGSLTLDPRSVPAVDGSLIPLEGRVQVSGRERSMVGSILSWGIAGFGAKGKSAIVSMGTRLTGQTAPMAVDVPRLGRSSVLPGQTSIRDERSAVFRTNENGAPRFGKRHDQGAFRRRVNQVRPEGTYSSGWQGQAERRMAGVTVVAPSRGVDQRQWLALVSLAITLLHKGKPAYAQPTRGSGTLAARANVLGCLPLPPLNSSEARG